MTAGTGDTLLSHMIAIRRVPCVLRPCGAEHSLGGFALITYVPSSVQDPFGFCHQLGYIHTCQSRACHGHYRDVCLVPCSTNRYRYPRGTTRPLAIRLDPDRPSRQTAYFMLASSPKFQSPAPHAPLLPSPPMHELKRHPTYIQQHTHSTICMPFRSALPGMGGEDAHARLHGPMPQER